METEIETVNRKTDAGSVRDTMSDVRTGNRQPRRGRCPRRQTLGSSDTTLT